MSTRASRLPGIPGSRAPGLGGVKDRGRALGSLGVLLVACAAGLLVAVSNVTYFEIVNGFVGATDALTRGVLFSTWPLLIGGVPVLVLGPARFGFTLGDIRRQWRPVAGLCAAAAVVTASLVTLAGRLPYSDASPFIEVIDVPFTEELLFRGVFLVVLIGILTRLLAPSTGLALAVLIDGIAFGLAHVANAMALDLAFVLAQATFASCLGVTCAYLVVRTRSIYPAMLLHAVVNGIVVFL